MISQFRPFTWTAVSGHAGGALTPSYANGLAVNHGARALIAVEPVLELVAADVNTDVAVLDLGVGAVVDDLASVETPAPKENPQ